MGLDAGQPERMADRMAGDLQRLISSHLVELGGCPALRSRFFSGE